MISCSLVLHDLNQISVRQFEDLNDQMSEVGNIIQNIFQMYLNTNSVFLRFRGNGVAIQKFLEAKNL